jgi:hypothetical protein
MWREEEFYINPVDLFRVGREKDPKLAHVRPRDVDFRKEDGWVIANHRGISLFTRETIERTTLTGPVWKMKRDTPLPSGLVLFTDKPGHFMICPARDMPLDAFIHLLSILAVQCEFTFRIPEARR